MRRGNGRPKKIRVLVFQEGQWLCARCLEHDLVVQARNVTDLYSQLSRILMGHIAVRRAHRLQPFADLPRAPRKFWDMYRGSKIPLPPLVLSHDATRQVPTPEVRVYSSASS
jgi:hypothetical protein